MRCCVLLAALVAAPVGAQVAYPPLPVDVSSLATKGDAQAALDAATAAQNAAATKCAPMASVPPSEVVGGSAGSGSNCRLANSVQPRISRTVPFTTSSAGTAAVTWTDMGAVPLVFAVPNVGAAAAQAPVCSPVAGTITSTGATVKCWTTQTVTVSILGAIVAPIVAAGAGVTGQILALPAS